MSKRSKLAATVNATLAQTTEKATEATENAAEQPPAAATVAPACQCGQCDACKAA